MDVGIRLPTTGTTATPENIAQVAGWADELGFASVWVPDRVAAPLHIKSRYPYTPDGAWIHDPQGPWWEPLTVLTWISGQTARVRLGTAVLVLPLRHPVALAKQLSTMDQMVGGRLVLGVGVGWMAEEYGIMGVPFKTRWRQLGEAITLLRRLWEGDVVDFEGRCWTIPPMQMLPRPRQGQVPIVVGGNSRAALECAARLGDGWFAGPLGWEELAAGVGELRRLWRERGREPAVPMVLTRPPVPRELGLQDCRRLTEIGVTEMIIDPPTNEPGLSCCRQEMERVSALMAESALG